jgi:hypothetical protein
MDRVRRVKPGGLALGGFEPEEGFTLLHQVEPVTGD